MLSASAGSEADGIHAEGRDNDGNRRNDQIPIICAVFQSVKTSDILKISRFIGINQTHLIGIHLIILRKNF